MAGLLLWLHESRTQTERTNWQVMQPLNQGGADRLVRQLPLGAVKGLNPLRHLAEQIVVQQQIVKILLLKKQRNLMFIVKKNVLSKSPD